MNSNIVVILSHPEIPENIGFVARCLRSFGIHELRLVGVSLPDDKSRAYWTARSGNEILSQAGIFATLSEAIGDCQQALGFTRRSRGSDQILFDLSEVQARFENRLETTHPNYAGIPIPGIRTALVFGCESVGLSQDESIQLSHLVRIPLMDPELSLNVSHAVGIALYALLGGKTQTESSRQGVATLEESKRVLEQALEVLDRNGFLAKGKKESARREKVEIFWRRIQPTRRELDFICGVLKGLVEKVET